MQNEMIERVAKAILDSGEFCENQHTMRWARQYARAAIEAMREPTEATPKAEWQPIETSPSDGSAFLAYLPHFYFGAGVYLAWWEGNSLKVCTEGQTLEPYGGVATHWMPLPKPPPITASPE